MFFLIVLLDYICTMYGFSRGYEEANFFLRPFASNAVIFTGVCLAYYMLAQLLVNAFPRLYPIFYVMHLIAVNLWIKKLFGDNYLFFYWLANPILIYLM